MLSLQVISLNSSALQETILHFTQHLFLRKRMRRVIVEVPALVPVLATGPVWPRY